MSMRDTVTEMINMEESLSPPPSKSEEEKAKNIKNDRSITRDVLFAEVKSLEYWSFELLILMSGLLPNPQLETSVLSVCLNTLATFYTIPFGLGAAVSTRVSNELGAGNPNMARVAVYAVMLLAFVVAIIVSSILFVSRHVFGYIFSNEKEVVDYVTTMAPLVCFSVIIDSFQGVLAVLSVCLSTLTTLYTIPEGLGAAASNEKEVVDYVTAMAPFLCLCIVLNGLQAVLSGIARGCGWQDMGAYVNLLAYYVFGIPVAAILGFWLHMRGQGLWIGILVGAFVQTVLLSIITSCLNWKKQADKARHRIFEDDGQT
ncbi:hypothetical protein Q3G72_009929 [Acer saccharum]|nr:hypothetical protein Q3G72_009929 [Acer saccharum]